VIKIKSIPALATIVVTLAVFGSIVFAAQDRFTLKVPNGLAFSESRGYEDWSVFAVSQPKDLLVVILANPVMIDAYRSGVPGNGKPFPDGSKLAKIHWKTKKSSEASAPTLVPETLRDVDFMEKDNKRYADYGGWGYAMFDYATVSDTFTAHGAGSNCGYACHTIVKGKDYVFTGYPKR